MARSIEEMVGDHDWSGDHPYVIQMVDSSKGEGYQYELRKGEDWVTIAERRTNNPSLTRSFELQKKEEEWEYLDGRLIKQGKSSFPELQEAYGRLKIAIESLKPKHLE
jgi:hypothetical protein